RPLDPPPARLEALQAREAYPPRPEPRHRPWPGLDDARPLDEVVDPERRGEARRPARRQDVVRPGQVVAERLGRVLPEEDCPRVPYAREPAPRRAHGELQ